MPVSAFTPVRAVALMLVAISPLLSGCRKPKPPVETSNAICTARVAKADAAQSAGAALDPALWTSILVANYDRAKKTTRGAGRDCGGQAIAPTAPAAELSCPAANVVFPPTDAQPGQAQAIEAPLSEGSFLVWTPLVTAENGDALGPVGLGQWTPNGVDIVAVGSVSAHLNRASLRLETTDAATLLAIESDRCDAETSTCAREIALFVQNGEHFVAPPLVEDNGRCVGPAVFVGHRKHVVQLDRGIERTFELQASLQNGPSGLVIQEQVAINDRDLATPDAPARPFRQASLARQLGVSAQQITIPQGLWDAMLREHGSVRPEAASAAASK